MEEVYLYLVERHRGSPVCVLHTFPTIIPIRLTRSADPDEVMPGVIAVRVGLPR